MVKVRVTIAEEFVMRPNRALDLTRVGKPPLAARIQRSAS